MTSAIAFQNQNNFVLGRPKLALENQNLFSQREKSSFPSASLSSLRSEPCPLRPAGYFLGQIWVVLQFVGTAGYSSRQRRKS